MTDKKQQNLVDALLQTDAKATADAKKALVEQLSKMLGEVPSPVAEAEKKPKVIRDSFTLPENDYNIIYTLQDRALGMRMHVTKGELLRAGLHALETMSDDDLLAILGTVEKLKPGRRKQS